MLTSIIIPHFERLGIYHAFCTHISFISNKLLVIFCLVLVIFLQIPFVDQLRPYNPEFNTKYLTFQYISPLWRTSFSELSLNL